MLRSAGTVPSTTAAALIRSDFDSDAFGFPFYRVSRIDEGELAPEMAALKQQGPFAADRKCPSGDLTGSAALMRLGFRKVCMQLTLTHDLRNIGAPPGDVVFADRLEIADAGLLRHARNFTTDRFALDPLLTALGHDRLYAAWLRNSLNGAKQVAHVGWNLCTFARHDQELVIDLVSILDHRQGVGSRILCGVVHYAAAIGLRAVRVTTETENVAAWSLYAKLGFVPASYTACFHYVHAK